MMTGATPGPDATRLERIYDAPADLVWAMWTTPAGLEEWWGPDGFETHVSELELRPGGQVRYPMTAIGPEQVAFVRGLGLPLSSDFQRTFVYPPADTVRPALSEPRPAARPRPRRPPPARPGRPRPSCGG